MTPEIFEFYVLLATGDKEWQLHVLEDGDYTKNTFLNDCIEITDMIKKICNLPMNEEAKVDQLFSLIAELKFYSDVVIYFASKQEAKAELN